MSENYIELKMEGILVYMDRLIAKDNYVYFGSCFGGAESVKAALAGLVTGKAWNTPNSQYSRFDMNYSIRSQRISGSKFVHGITYIPLYFDVRNKINDINIVFGENGKEINAKVFNLIKKRSSVPLLDCWMEHILKNTISFIKLETFGIGSAYEVELPEDKLLEDFVMSEMNTLKSMEAELWSQTQKLII